MAVTIPKRFEAFIMDLVEADHFLTPDEVVEHALAVLHDQHEIHRRHQDELRKEIQMGLEQADRGEVAPLDIRAIKAEVRRRLGSQENKENGNCVSWVKFLVITEKPRVRLFRCI